MLKEKQSAYEFMNKKRVSYPVLNPLENLPKNIFMIDPDVLMQQANNKGIICFLLLLFFTIISCVISSIMFFIDIITKQTLTVIIFCFALILMIAMFAQITYIFSANYKANQIRKNS